MSVVILISFLFLHTVAHAASANLSWQDNSDDEDGFKIERKDGASGVFRVVATVGVDVESYRDAGLEPGGFYVYRVKAFNAFGDSGYTNESEFTAGAGPKVRRSLRMGRMGETINRRR